MPTPTSVGNTDFREVSVSEIANRSGMDGLRVILKGRQSALQAERNKWPKGSKYPGYPYMILESKESEDRGSVCELTLNFIGLLDTFLPDNGRISTSDAISPQSITITTDEDENVTFVFNSQQSTTRWIHYGQAPRSPKFRGIVPSAIPTNLLFSPNPPNYKGSKAGSYRPIGRLDEFSREEIAPNVWMVVETWTNTIEPVTQND
jgi:hypothetical protein